MVAWLDRLEEEHDNIRAALAWAQERDVESPCDGKRAAVVWHIRGYKHEGCQWLEHGL